MRRPPQRHDDSSVAARPLIRVRAAAATVTAVLALAACASAPDSAGIVGRYAMHVSARDNPAWRGMIGDWDFEFGADGRLRARQSGGKGMAIDMLYRYEAGVLTINDLAGNGSCRHFGVDMASAAYRIRFVDSGFEARPLRDECTPRVYGMTLRNFTRVGR
jgi:hypothetical protein